MTPEGSQETEEPAESIANSVKIAKDTTWLSDKLRANLLQ